MVYDLISVDFGEPEFAFFIKEETPYIFKHPKPLIEVRIGIMQMKNVLVVPMMDWENAIQNMRYSSSRLTKSCKRL